MGLNFTWWNNSSIMARLCCCWHATRQTCCVINFITYYHKIPQSPPPPQKKEKKASSPVVKENTNILTGTDTLVLSCCLLAVGLMLFKAAGINCVLTGWFWDCWGRCCHVKEKQEQSCVAICLGWDKAGRWCPGTCFGLWKWRLELWPLRGKQVFLCPVENDSIYLKVMLLRDAPCILSPVQWFWFWGGLLTGGGPSRPQCCACHWRVLLWLRFAGWDQLQHSPTGFSPGQGLSLWRGWPR